MIKLDNFKEEENMHPHPIIRLLIVARWPLGGIRTYMKYTYKYFPKDRFQITLLAPEEGERETLAQDMNEMGIEWVKAARVAGRDFLCLRVFQLLARQRFDVIQSEGFISAVHVHAANLFHNIPHVVTVHGILEEKYLGERLLGKLKRKWLQLVINGADALYSVSRDMQDHVESLLKISKKLRKVVIHNGIDVSRFTDKELSADTSLRKKLGIPDTTFLIGFLGRFMPQKGFEYLIDAMDLLAKRNLGSRDILVLAVGSGDYLESYKKRVAEKGLTNRFLFLPFQPNVAPVYDAADVIVMPSIWEAFGLQAAEALCMGRPIISSDCIGLREAIKDTPAIVVPTGNATAIADSVSRLILEPPSLLFHDFREEARKRFDVRKTSSELQTLLISLVFG